MTDKTNKSSTIPSQKNSDSSDDQKKQFFIDSVAKFCDKCGAGYTTSDVNLVQESNFSSIIHFSCSKCKSNHIATFLKPMGMSSRVPVSTDLTISEISRFAKMDPISSDEILDLYSFLEECDEVQV